MEQKIDDRPVMVSIQCTVYNHEPYLRQCLDGFVMQKTNFRFEAIVHDDASTDGSVAIIREYAEKYPNIIKPIYETENQYSKNDGSLQRILDEACSGKYIAICEGDDYWIEPMKLQKQVDYMETHTNVVLLHTAFKFYDDDNKSFFELAKENILILENVKERRTVMTGILDGNKYRVQTVTSLYRKEAYNSIQPLLREQQGKFLMGDSQLWVFLLTQGDIFFSSDVTSVYRVHIGSACHKERIVDNLRFKLSCAEMRVYMADKVGLPNAVKQKFEKEYNTSLLKYCSFDTTYKPFIDIKSQELIERLKCILLDSNFFLFLIRHYLIITYKHG